LRDAGEMEPDCYFHPKSAADQAPR
jgi:hypothetical protein